MKAAINNHILNTYMAFLDSNQKRTFLKAHLALGQGMNQQKKSPKE
jgi:hypothetical protein